MDGTSQKYVFEDPGKFKFRLNYARTASKFQFSEVLCNIDFIKEILNIGNSNFALSAKKYYGYI